MGSPHEGLGLAGATSTASHHDRGLATRSTTRHLLLVGLALVGLAALVVAASPASAVYEDQYTWPMDGEVTSEYWECRDNCDRYHRAIDIANGCDTPIYAARAGTASVHSDPDGYGNYVTVDHDDGWVTLYAHMDTVEVIEGEEVDRDTVLGYEGDTGASTGCHVHFEIRQDDEGPSHEVKKFLPGEIGQDKTHGDPVPLETRVLEVTSETDVLDGPDVDSVPDEGDEVIGTAETGDRQLAWSSWTNSDGELWYVIDFSGRMGWLPASSVTEVADTSTRVSVDTALNVRDGPGTEHTDVGNVYGAQTYPILDEEPDDDGDTWFEIPYDASSGETGWIHGGYANTVAHGTDGRLTGYTILVDPGHGGDDPGAQAGGVDEKTTNLEISLKLKDKLVDDGADVVMTRSTDETVSLTERTDMANAYDVDRFVSVHANACGDCGAEGTETYYHESLSEDSDAADMAEHVQDHVVQQAGTEDRGVKQADFHVLRESEMPANLVETAFLDHDGDRELLTSETGQHDFATGILDGVAADLGEDDEDPTPEPDPGLDEGFEAPLEGWTIADESGPEAWERTTDRAASGSWSIALDDYGADEDDRLTSPRIDLSGLEAPELVIASWMEGERSCGFFGCTIYDHGTIEVTDDGGDSWTTLETDYWDSDGWETLTYDLSSYEGETIQVRFTFTSDGSVHNEGWYLDDVRIEEDIPLFEDSFEADADGWSITDDGGPESWHRTSDRASDGSWSMGLHDYGANEDDALTSPTIDLAGVSAPELTLDSWMEGEQACGLFGCTIYDHGTIEVTDDGGDSWTTLETDYWDSDGWETLTYDLSSYEGETIQVRFTFTSDGSVHNEGWYLDDVRVG